MCREAVARAGSGKAITQNEMKAHGPGLPYLNPHKLSWVDLNPQLARLQKPSQPLQVRPEQVAILDEEEA